MDNTVKTKVENFFSNYKAKKYKKGSVIVWAGEEPPGIVYLIKGHVSQYDISESGQKLTLNIFKPPAFFPMSWAINKSQNKYFYEAISDMDCRIAPPEDVIKYLQSNPDIMLDLLSRLYRGVDGLLDKTFKLMAGTARSQLLLELVITSHRFGDLNQDGSAQLRIKTVELAQRTGMARETVSRELKKLEEDKIIKRNKDLILIDDIGQLENDYRQNS